MQTLSLANNGFLGFCTMNFRLFVAMNQKKLGQSVIFS